MSFNYNPSTQTVVLLLLLNSIAILTEVQGNPITIYENEPPVGIYSDDSWSRNEDKDYQQRNSWLTDLSDKPQRDEAEAINNCNKGLGECNNQGSTSSIIDAPVKKEMFTSRGWGAGGMPFNILYMKNPKPPKSLRSQLLPQAQPQFGIIAEPLRSQPFMEPMPQAQQQFQNSGYKDLSSVYNLGEITPQSVPNGLAPNRSHRTKGRSSSSTLFVPSRRHYSIIPQLFVSYGWGPIGK